MAWNVVTMHLQLISNKRNNVFYLLNFYCDLNKKNYITN